MLCVSGSNVEPPNSGRTFMDREDFAPESAQLLTREAKGEIIKIPILEKMKRS